MALSSVNDLATGGSLVPKSEATRLNAIASNRRLYEGDLSGIGVRRPEREYYDKSRSAADRTDRVDPEPVVFNWFRRVSRFYPEFMFAEQPEVTVDGNERLETWIADRAMGLWEDVAEAVSDGITYGYGLVASHPADPGLTWAVDPGSHYEVQDGLGDVTADIIVRVRAVDGDAGMVDVYIYPVAGDPVRHVYKFASGRIGALADSIDLPPRDGRQVARFRVNREAGSWFGDFKGSVATIANLDTQLRGATGRNLDPHMYGPVTEFSRISTPFEQHENWRLYAPGGKVIRGPLSGRGSSYIPVPEGGSAPGYISWEADLTAVEHIVKAHLGNIYRSTGLSRVMFEQDISLGSVSGVALRRLAAPFYARLSNLKTRSTALFEQLLAMLVRNHAADGGERFAYANSDLSVSYGYESLFADPAPEEDGSDE